MKQLRKLCAGLCCLALLGGLTAGVAAPATVHAAAWLRSVYVDGQEASFADAQGKYTYLFSVNGSIYMPANTAASWLGCQLAVDEAAKTASFTSGGAAKVPGRDSTPESTSEELARLDRYFKQGMDVSLLSGFAVKLDGKPWTFTSGGKAQLPFFVEGTLYLPLRAVGERMGKVVTWIPAPKSPYDSFESISIDTPVTQAQRTEMQTYLDQCMALYWKAAAVTQELAAAGNLTPSQAVEKLTKIKSTLQQIGSLPVPAHHYLDQYEIPALATSNLGYTTITDNIQFLQSGTRTFQECKDHQLLELLRITLETRYLRLQDAQQALNVLAAKGGTPS